MPGPFFWKGNGDFSNSLLTNSSANNNIITGSIINTSSLDMLDSTGNYQNITNAAIPIRPNDVVIKQYVDNLGINFITVQLSQTQGSTITSSIGSFMITVQPQVIGGPCATFHVSKSNYNVCGHVVRLSHSPGVSGLCTIDMVWPDSTDLIIYKTASSYNGGYIIKLI